MDRDEAIARAFHDFYEQAAVQAGWSTQPRSRVPWDEVPEANRETMLTTVHGLLESGIIAPGPRCL